MAVIEEEDELYSACIKKGRNAFNIVSDLHYSNHSNLACIRDKTRSCVVVINKKKKQISNLLCNDVMLIAISLLVNKMIQFCAKFITLQLIILCEIMG
jgi:hypothetical protein